MAHTTLDHGPSHAHPLLDRLADNWWLLLIRGIVAVLFGILAFTWPGSALFAVVLLFGAFAFADGALSVVSALSRREAGRPTWWLVVMGLFGIIAGIAAFAWPGITSAVLVVLVGLWAILSGFVEIAGAIELRKEIDNEWLLILGGVLSILFGFILLSNPGTGTLAIVWMIGFYAVAVGASWIALSLHLRRHAKRA